MCVVKNIFIISVIKIINILFDRWKLLYMRLKFELTQRKKDNECVSIIIATYNRAKILTERTIPAALDQTYKNIELIIIGDHCIDDTPQKIIEIKDPRVKFFDLSKRGKYPENVDDRWFVQGSVPRNFGMKVATGRWLMFISDDDIMYSNQVDKLVKYVKLNNLEFASAGYKTFKNGEAKYIYPGKNNYKSNLICGGMQTWIYEAYLKTFRWNRHSWRKKIDRPIDYDLQQRLYRAGVNMGYFNEIVAEVPMVEGTLTSGYLAAKIIEEKFK